MVSVHCVVSKAARSLHLPPFNSSVLASSTVWWKIDLPDKHAYIRPTSGRFAEQKPIGEAAVVKIEFLNFLLQFHSSQNVQGFGSFALIMFGEVCMEHVLLCYEFKFSMSLNN